MENKHTQGEWEIMHNSFSLVVQSDDQDICHLSNINESDNVEFFSDEWEEEKKRFSEQKIANAKLIAAAPRMLIRLNELLNQYSHLFDNEDLFLTKEVIKDATN